MTSERLSIDVEAVGSVSGLLLLAAQSNEQWPVDQVGETLSHDAVAASYISSRYLIMQREPARLFPLKLPWHRRLLVRHSARTRSGPGSTWSSRPHLISLFRLWPCSCSLPGSRLNSRTNRRRLWSESISRLD